MSLGNTEDYILWTGEATRPSDPEWYSSVYRVPTIQACEREDIKAEMENEIQRDFDNETES